MVKIAKFSQGLQTVKNGIILMRKAYLVYYEDHMPAAHNKGHNGRHHRCWL